MLAPTPRASHTFSWWNASFAGSLAFAVLVFGLGSASAQEWSQQDGPYGGTVIALDRTGSGAIFAMRNDTVFRSTDAGAHWADVGPNGLAFTFLALDVTESGAIWTGTSSRGVAWSLNGGATWTNDQIVSDPHSGLGATIVAIAVDAQGRILAGSYRSVNQGASFQAMSISGFAFAFDAADDAFAGTANGVWRSSDGGASWSPANAGMEDERVLALATSGAANLWAGTIDGDVWRSTDSGLTWVPATSGLPGTAIESIEVLPTSVLTSTQGGGLFRSTDGGATWSPAGADPGEIRDLRFAGGDLWMGTLGHGVFVSSDGGVSAQPTNAAAMYTPGLADLTADASGVMYVASTGSGVFRSLDAGASWSPSSTGLSSLFVESLAAGASGHAWAASWRGVFATTDAGDSWSVIGFSTQRTRQIVALATGDLLAVVDGPSGLPTIQRSTDGGQTWNETWSSPTAFRLESSAVTDDSTVLAGGMSFFGGLVLRSTDAGATWSEGSLGFGEVTALTTGPNGRAWAALGDNVVHRSTDQGASWAPLPNGGWPTGTTGSLAALDHGPDGLLLVGTGSVYRSTDEGDSWTPFSSGFPAGSIVTFLSSVSSGTFAGTYSSGVFRLGGATGAAVPVHETALRLSAAPNPFRSVTRISWDLPGPADVRIVVHDVRGRRIAELAPGLQPSGPGAISWDGTIDGRPVGPGAYFLRLEADGRTATSKILRIR